jgi:PEGA domain-containing protein
MKTSRATRSFALGCLLALSSPALAAEKSEVEKEIDLGLDLREKGQDREALGHFQKAYELSHGARSLAQMALAEQALGIWVDAEAHLKQALETKHDKWIRANHAALEGALAVIQRRVGSLEILANVAGAEVRINGQMIGTLPFSAPVRVVAGNAVVDITAEGYRPYSLSVTIPANGLARETIALVPKPREEPKAEIAAPPSPPSETRHEATPANAGERAPDVSAKTEAPSDNEDLAIWAYVAAGGAVAGVTLGVIELLARNSHINKYNDDLVCLVNGKTRGENCGAEKSAGDRAGTISTIGFVAGGAFAAASVVLFVLSSSGSEEPKVAMLRGQSGPWVCGAGPGDLGIACGGVIDW